MINRRLVDFLSDGRFHSGSEIGKLLQVSRAAVWKQIKKLSDFGLVVHAVPGKGYQIPGGLDLLDQEVIQSGLDSKVIECLANLAVLDTVDLPANHVMTHLLERDNAGLAGCLSESRVLSKVKYGRALHSSYAASIDLALGCRLPAGMGADMGTLLTAAATLTVLESFHGEVNCQVKWPSELMANGKRLGSVSLLLRPDGVGRLHAVIGVQVLVRSSSYLSDQQPDGEVVSLQELLGLKNVSRNQVAARLLNGLVGLLEMSPDQLKSSVEKWRRYDLLYDRFVELDCEGRNVKGCVRGIDDGGRLCLETAQGMTSISMGKVVAVS